MFVNITEKRRKTLDLGIIGEQIARLIIKKFIKPKHITQIDWLIKTKKGEWINIEVKCKPKYQNKQGLSINQVKTRMDLYIDKDIRCLFLCIDPKTKEVSIQWLDKLEETDYYDSKDSNIRMYDLKHFKHIGTYENITKSTLEEIVDKYNNYKL